MTFSSSSVNYTETIITSGSLSSVYDNMSTNEIMRKWTHDIAKTSPPTKFTAIRNAYEAFKNYLNESIWMYNDADEAVKVKCIVANPERVIAKLRQTENLILPILSVKLDEIDVDLERQKFGPILTWQTYWNAETRRAERIISEVPKQAYIRISLSLWTKYMSDLAQLSEQLEYLFRPHISLKNPHAVNTKYFLESSSNISETDLSDGENRTLRKVFNIRCETYFYGRRFRITNTGELQEFNVQWDINP